MLIPQQIDDPFTDFDPGSYRGGIEKVSKVMSRTNKLMFSAEVRVSEPAEAANRIQFENFVIGTEEDPTAQNANTWKEKGGRMKQFCDAAAVPFLGMDPDMVVQELVGKMVDWKMFTRVDRQTGEKRVVVSKWATAGSFMPEIELIQGKVTSVSPVTPLSQQFQQPFPSFAPQPQGGPHHAPIAPAQQGAPLHQAPGSPYANPPQGTPPTGNPEVSYEMPTAAGQGATPPAPFQPSQPGTEQGNAQGVGGPPVPLP